MGIMTAFNGKTVNELTFEDKLPGFKLYLTYVPTVQLWKVT